MLSLTFAACGSDDNDGGFDDVTLNAGETYTIPSGSSVTWTSANEYIATVENGVVTAKRVGDVRITSSKGSFTVTVNPTVTLYREPLLEWGATKSRVKSYMSGYELYKEEDDALYYNGKNNEMYQCYDFEDSRLNIDMIIVPLASVSSEKMATYLSERYLYMGTTTEESVTAYVFYTLDKKTGIVLTAGKYNDSAMWLIGYTKITDSSSSIVRELTDNNHFRPALDNAITTEIGAILETATAQ